MLDICEFVDSLEVGLFRRDSLMADKEMTFEQSLKELETTIEKLESDDLTLDEALEKFERGVGLMRSCDRHLKKAEGVRVEVDGRARIRRKVTTSVVHLDV